jgi:integrase
MLSAKQMADLFKALDEEERRTGDIIACSAIRFVFWTGWRVGEALALEWSRVDLKSGYAKLIRTKTAAEEYRQLPDESIEVLRRLPRTVGCPFVFPGRDSRSRLKSVRKPWVEIREKAGLHDLDGLGPLRLHDLRHNVVSWDVSRGVPLEIAGRNVGHRSRQATEVYAHFAPDALKQAADDRARAMRQALVSAERSR